MVKKLLLLLLAVLTSATGVWAQAYTNPVERTWDFSTSDDTEGLVVGNNDGASYNIERIALYDGKLGYHLNDGYIVVPVTKGQIVTFTLLGTQKYQTSYKVSIEDTNRAALSDPFYFAGVYGEPVERYFTAPENGWIKIEKGNNSNNWYAGVRAISVENAPTVAFSSSSCTAELIDLNVNEPTLSYPSPSSVTYSVSNEKIAKLGGENAPGDIMCVNTGVTGVTATVNYKGNTYTASYTLTVKADDATYKVEGNTYTLTGPGKLQERVVNLVPKITMEFGTTAETNITIVKDENTCGTVATTLDKNGWRRFSYTGENSLINPSQGTFYTFKPLTDGKLTIKGYHTGQNTAFLVDSENLAPMPKLLTGLVNLSNGTTPEYWLGAAGTGAWSLNDITTDDGRTTGLAERYVETNEENSRTGEIIVQEVEGLPNGTYTVVLYANAQYIEGRSGVTDKTVIPAEGRTDIAYVFANSSTARVVAKNGGDLRTTGNGEYTITNVSVTDGKLRLGLAKDNAGTFWHSIQIKSLTFDGALTNYSFTPVATFNNNSDPSVADEKTIDVQGRKTYYLYGNYSATNGVKATNHFQLKSFSFESNMRYASKSVVLAAGATEGGQDLITSSGSTSGITFSAKKEGDIDSFTLNPSNGHVSDITGDGGAIIVTASQIVDGNVIDSDYYVITVPYASHEWWFWNTENFPEKNEELDWATTYEVRSYDQTTRALYYLNEPILTAAEGLQGNNAMYIGKTAGLVVNAEAKTFGLRSSSDNLGDYATFRAFFLDNTENRTKYASYISDYDLDNLTEDRFSELKGDGSFVDVYLKAMLNYTKEDSHGTNIPAMNPGATITIPNVKAGSHIAIKWYRHAPGDGDHILLTNAVDLDDNEISNGIYVVNQGRGSNIFGNPYGWLEFKAATDGDVTLRSEKGWTHLKAIVLKEDGFYDTNLAIVNENSNSACKTLYTYPVGGSQSNTYSTKAYYTRSENGVQYVYTVEYDEATRGTANATISGGTLTATGQGQATLVLTCYSNDYAIDRETKLLTFLEITETHQDYPYTWDFTNISDDTKTKLGSDGNWTGNTSDGFKPSTTAQGTFTQGDDLHFNDSDVPELDELGFISSIEGTSSTGLSNVTLKTDGTGVVIGDQETTNIIVPDVPEGATVFVRVVENENSEITLKSGNTTIEEATTTGVDENSNVYTIEGNGSDVNIELKDVTVEGIAVTNLWKECSFWDETEEHEDGAEETGYYCYNSDSHDKPIKYSLTQYYTNVFMKALTVKSTNSEDNTVEVDDIDYTPAYTGVIVYSIDKGIDHPLFVPAVNDQKSKAEDEAIKAASMMIPHVESGEVAASDGDSIRYVFTNVYNKVSDVGTKISANTPGFYQVNRAGVLKANRAYLVLPKETSAGVKAMKLYTLSYTGNEEEDPTAINGVDAAFDLNGEFYTISGVKLQGVPTQKGIYIQNGKKVMIK